MKLIDFIKNSIFFILAIIIAAILFFAGSYIIELVVKSGTQPRLF